MRRVLAYVAALFLFSCAQQVAPTGGPKDDTPPKILSEVPENLSTDFAGKLIVISFDEFIQLTSPAEQIIISPPVRIQPSYQLKKKSLVVKFEEPLSPNTTYTINFGQAIRDNNEGNILANYTYVFSTGAHLDSMSVKGRLTDVLTGEPEKDALVMLYKNDVDSLPLDTLPDYFTRTDDNGSFLIKHVADQPYKIFALKDENANYKFDVPTEKIGFLDSLIIPFAPPTVTVQDSAATDSTVIKVGKQGSGIPDYNLTMFVEDDTTQFLKKSYCEYYGKLVFVYNLPVSGFGLEMDGVSFKKQWKLIDFSEQGDTVAVWTTDVVPDTMNLLVSTDKLETDTVELVMKARTDEIEVANKSKGKGARKSQTEKFALSATARPSRNQSPKPNEPLVLEWNHPIIGTDLSKVKLYEDSVRVKFEVETTDPALRKFGFNYPWKKDSKYRLLVLDSAFTDLYGLWNDTVEVNFTGIDKIAFGELSLKILENPNSSIVIQLLNSSKAVVEEKSIDKAQTVLFDKLVPGKYNIQVITDLDGNGKWDSGRYSQKRQPEPINTIQKDSEVRANWNLELEWNPNAE